MRNIGQTADKLLNISICRCVLLSKLLFSLSVIYNFKNSPLEQSCKVSFVFLLKYATVKGVSFTRSRIILFCHNTV